MTTLDELVAHRDVPEAVKLTELFQSEDLRGQLVDRVRQQGTDDESRYRSDITPFGFRRLMLAGSHRNLFGSPILRLHVWETPPAFEGPHTHQWHMASMVVAGELVNRFYNKTADNSGRPFDEVRVNRTTHDSVRRFPHPSGKNGIPVRLKVAAEQRIQEGNVYGVRMGTIHTSNFDQTRSGPTISLLAQSAFGRFNWDYQPPDMDSAMKMRTRHIAPRTTLDEICDHLLAVKLAI